jgi:mannose-6-phosphate isomerase-like protein (cupin superfamily)
MKKISLKDKLSAFSDYWSPKIIAELNGQHVKVAKLNGEFDWHHHEAEDELFLVLYGVLRMDYRDESGEHSVTLQPGELIVIPRATEHRPVATEEVAVLLFEPAGTLNTGDVRSSRTVPVPERL